MSHLWRDVRTHGVVPTVACGRDVEANNVLVQADQALLELLLQFGFRSRSIHFLDLSISGQHCCNLIHCCQHRCVLFRVTDRYLVDYKCGAFMGEIASHRPASEGTIRPGVCRHERDPDWQLHYQCP